MILFFAITLSPSCYAIEFKSFDEGHAWVFRSSVAGGCVAEKMASVPKIWIGDCRSGVPHGSGYIVSGSSIVIGGMNEGRQYKEQEIYDDPDVAQYKERAEFIGKLQEIRWMPHENMVGPGRSARYLKAKAFIDDHPNAPEVDEVKRIIDEDERRIYESAYVTAAESNNLHEVDFVLSSWSSRMSLDKKASLEKRRVFLLKSQEENIRSIKQNEAARARADSEERARMRVSACDIFYPGYVGEYRDNSWMSTKDRFVVRYVSKSRGMVTIEGVEGGNSLEYREVLELTCYLLWERSKK